MTLRRTDRQVVVRDDRQSPCIGTAARLTLSPLFLTVCLYVVLGFFSRVEFFTNFAVLALLSTVMAVVFFLGIVAPLFATRRGIPDGTTSGV